ncbi:hypothetical protein Plhal304r1_c059g0147191 [Plasmopara halstedii]
MKETADILLPFQLPRPDENDIPTKLNSKDRDHSIDRDSYSNTLSCNWDDETSEMYRQTVPLVQSHSTAAIKTLGAIVRDRKLVRRMLHRPQPYAKQLDRRPFLSLSSTSKLSVLVPNSSSFSPSRTALRSDRRLAFMAACEKLIVTFDPHAQYTRRILLAQIKPLLQFHGLKVDGTAFHRWKQCLQPSDLTTIPTVSVTDFIQGCQLWFTETFLIEHVQNNLTHQELQCTMNSSKGMQTNLTSLQYNYQLAPIHSKQSLFDQLVHESDVTSTFSYETYARHPTASTPSLYPSMSAPSLLHAKCSEDLAAAKKSEIARTKKEPTYLARQSKQQSAESTRAFNASVALMSRHAHHEKFRKHSEHQCSLQIARIDQSRQRNQQHKLHCEAIEHDARTQRTRDVLAKKARTAGELVLSRDLVALREEEVRRNKSRFTISSSSSTLIPTSSKALAARALAISKVDQKRSSRLKCKHAERMRSLQLLNYVYDRKRIMANALRPRANSAFVVVDVADDKLSVERVLQNASDEIWYQVIQQQLHEDPNGVARFVSPCNTPPAALRYFGTSRSVSLPAFASTLDRNLQ